MGRARLVAISPIGRLAYLLRLLAALGLASVLYLLTVLAVAHTAGTSVLALVLVLLAAFVVNVVGFVYTMSRFVFIPRLRDVGFLGPLLWLMLFLCVLPATAPVLVVVLLFLPGGFVRTAGADV